MPEMMTTWCSNKLSPRSHIPTMLFGRMVLWNRVGLHVASAVCTVKIITRFVAVWYKLDRSRDISF
jgi:hypothetical protein